jgi:hypothetical protein
MTLHKITEFYIEWFSVYPNITSKFRTIVIFKNCIKQNNGPWSFTVPKFICLKCSGSWVVSTKQTMNFNIQLAAMFVFFVFDKNGLIKSCSSFEDLSVYRISCSRVDWCRCYSHLRSLNVHHFGMVEGTGLKSRALRSPSMAWPPYWIS